jgi:hypothetical protein
VQQISYASDTETGYLRLVSEDELDSPRFVSMMTCCLLETDHINDVVVMWKMNAYNEYWVSFSEQISTLREV